MPKAPAASSTIKAFFSIEYRTNFGEEVFISGGTAALGSWDAGKAAKLTPNPDFTFWTLTIDVDAKEDFDFKFLVKNEHTGFLLWEEQENRSFQASFLKSLSLPPFNSLYFRCNWQSRLPAQEDLQERTAAFKDVLFKKEPSTPKTEPGDTVFEFSLKVFRVRPGSEVVVYGNVPQLGNGNPSKGVRLHAVANKSAVWRAFVAIPSSQFQYNYAIIDSDKRVVQEPTTRNYDPPSDFSTSSPLFVKLQDIPFIYGGPHQWRGAGMAIPVFSLRTDESLGCGEFLDLKKMADWMSISGFRLLQLLPINDTRIFGGWKDSYPYSPLSAFALHPLYLNIDRLNLAPKVRKLVQTKRLELNKHPVIDYESTLEFKLQIAHKVFESTHTTIAQDPEFLAFVEENKYWIQPYALFIHFQAKYRTADFYEWPKEHCDIDPKEIERLTRKDVLHYDELLESYWIQYNLHLQLTEAIQYANQKRVLVKGDLPIGVSPSSVDCWRYRHLFRTNYSAGAPPDYFSTEGQNWGLPTYNWDEMKKEDYMWWRMRLHQMAKYFQAYRIDHVLGFFRIWEIPNRHIRGLLGRFQPSLPLWREELERYGLWDFNRLCDPYIRQRHVDQLPKKLIDQFLTQDPENPDIWRFKDEYKTESPIWEELSVGETSGKFMAGLSKMYRDALFSLLRNVVLIRDVEDPNKFYPRILCFQTDSYNCLDDGAKRDLYYLHNDYFYKRQEHFWSQLAMEKLPMMIHASDMLVFAEDLGMVPECVPGVLHHLNILSLKIERMPAMPTDKVARVQEYPYMTLCTSSVHDTSNLRAWWEEDGELRQYYYNNVLGEQGEAPQFCEPWIVQKIVQNHLNCPSMWSVFPVQDILGIFPDYRVSDPKSETINIPSIRFHYWRYRMTVNLEKLIADENLNNTLKSMLEQSGRVTDY